MSQHCEACSVASIIVGFKGGIIPGLKELTGEWGRLRNEQRVKIPVGVSLRSAASCVCTASDREVFR